MRLVNLILSLLKRKQRLIKPSKILIRTNKKGKLVVFDAETNERITGISRVRLYVNSFNKVSAELSSIVKNVELDIETDNIRIVNEDTQRDERE